MTEVREHPLTQSERVLRFIADHPYCSVMEIQLGLQPFVSNPRARVSDLREQGHVIECRKRSDGHNGFVLVPKRAPEPLTGEQVGLGL